MSPIASPFPRLKKYLTQAQPPEQTREGLRLPNLQAGGHEVMQTGSWAEARADGPGRAPGPQFWTELKPDDLSDGITPKKGNLSFKNKREADD